MFEDQKVESYTLDLGSSEVTMKMADGITNGQKIKATDKPMHGSEWSISLSIPPMSAMFFKCVEKLTPPKKPAKKKTAKKTAAKKTTTKKTTAKKSTAKKPAEKKTTAKKTTATKSATKTTAKKPTTKKTATKKTAEADTEKAESKEEIQSTDNSDYSSYNC